MANLTLLNSREFWNMVLKILTTNDDFFFLVAHSRIGSRAKLSNQILFDYSIKTSKNTFIICASKPPVKQSFYYLTTIVLLNPNSDFGFLFLRLILFYLYIILCMQST